MPNLTSYHAPAIHLNRELAKNSCDLIQHEFDYIHFLRTRIANIQSSLAFTNKKNFINNIQRHRNLSDIYISHFRLRQKRWKDKIESENKRFIHSLIYHRKKYRSIYNPNRAHKAYEQHLKSLEAMSQYSKYNLTNPICKSLLNGIKFNKQKSQTNEKIKYKRIKNRSTSYIENILQQTINNAIYIYNQPLPCAPSHVKSSYSEDGQWSKPRLYHRQRLFRSVSSRQLLEPWRNTKQQRGSLENDRPKISFL